MMGAVAYYAACAAHVACDMESHSGGRAALMAAILVAHYAAYATAYISGSDAETDAAKTAAYIAARHAAIDKYDGWLVEMLTESAR